MWLALPQRPFKAAPPGGGSPIDPQTNHLWKPKPASPTVAAAMAADGPKLLWNADNVRDTAESIGISLSDEPLRILAQDVEYRLGQVISEALRFMRAANRTTLTVLDFKEALKVLDVEPIFGYESTRPLRFGEASLGPGQPLFYIEDEEVDFEKFINAPLPKVPRDVSFTGGCPFLPVTSRPRANCAFSPQPTGSPSTASSPRSPRTRPLPRPRPKSSCPRAPVPTPPSLPWPATTTSLSDHQSSTLSVKSSYCTLTRSKPPFSTTIPMTKRHGCAPPPWTRCGPTRVCTSCSPILSTSSPTR